MLYAIKSDTLFFNRRRIAAISKPSRTCIRSPTPPDPQDGGGRNHDGAAAADYQIDAARPDGRSDFLVFLGEVPRDDAIPYVADFFLQLENVRWTLVSGIVHGSFVMSVRNLGYTKNAGDFVRRFFADIGSAGGHRRWPRRLCRSRRSERASVRSTKARPEDVRTAAGFPARSDRGQEAQRTRREPLVYSPPDYGSTNCRYASS
jgi:hypothetical protein